MKAIYTDRRHDSSLSHPTWLSPRLPTVLVIWDPPFNLCVLKVLRVVKWVIAHDPVLSPMQCFIVRETLSVRSSVCEVGQEGLLLP